MMMDKEFSEPLAVEAPKRKYNICLLILLVLIIILASTAIIILSLKLKNKADDYNKLKEKNEKSKIDYNALKVENENLTIQLKAKENSITNLENELNTTKEEHNNTLKQYTSQNDTLNDFFNKYQELFSIANITNPNIYKDNYTNVKDKLKEAKGLEDGTYDFVTLKPLSFDKGYEVSFETYAKNSENYYSDEEFDNIVFKLSSLFGINANLGVYGGFPQISFYFEDKNMSLAIAALFNQQSVWDWANNNIILNTFHQPKYYY